MTTNNWNVRKNCAELIFTIDVSYSRAYILQNTSIAMQEQEQEKERKIKEKEKLRGRQELNTKLRIRKKTQQFQYSSHISCCVHTPIYSGAPISCQFG